MFPSLNPTPIAVISFRLKGIRRGGDVPRMVFEQVAPYYPVENPALFHAVEFDLENATGARKYAGDVDKLLALLQPYVNAVLLSLLTAVLLPDTAATCSS
jgi:hypothetical protein